MDRTPDRAARQEAVHFAIAADQQSSPRRSSRIKKPPPITPRRFTRFFTPRLQNGANARHKSRRPLRDLPGATLNIRQNGTDAVRHLKRRKLSFASPSSSLQSSPIRTVTFLQSSQDYPPEFENAVIVDEEDDSEASTDIEDVLPKTRISQYRGQSLSSRLLSCRLHDTRSRGCGYGEDLWQQETGGYYTSTADINQDYGHHTQTDQYRLSLPFCATSCNTNPLVAVGDEEGCIRLIDSANDCCEGFSRSHLVMKPHDNAIMDLEFSADDKYMATASGDQTCQIIDVPSQTSTWSLTGHTSSVKKVQFMPGSTNQIATCARDGSIHVWDMRGNDINRPVQTYMTALTTHMTAKSPAHVIADAHVGRPRLRSSSMAGRSDFSVTSLAFLSSMTPHLFASASESDSVVKLWDMRAGHQYRGKTIPISCTAMPKAHEQHRPFGITSMAMSTDSSKLYTLCRDHTVYVYSTSHLVLGAAPEMKSNASVFVNRTGNRSGLGPMYGFRHPSLQISTFYPKLAVRQATDSDSEVVAVGSSDDCAVLFATSDRYLTKASQNIPPHPLLQATCRPRMARQDSQSTSLALHRRARFQDDIPIYYHGTPLIKGHDKEVTAVTWSSEGNLVTIGDDFRTRCWRNDEHMARRLRNGYHGEVERHDAGWAAVREGWDDDGV